MVRFHQSKSGKMISKKKSKQLESLRSGRNANIISSNDHAYVLPMSVSSSDPDLNHDPDLSFVIREEVFDNVNKHKVGTRDWREGRRVIELAVLADRLDHCDQCSLPLRLSNCVGETGMGLGGWLHVLCENPICENINKIPMGKTHGNRNRTWDANTKLASAMIHCGLGETAINNLLSAINIPPVARNTLKEREREAGGRIEEIATQSVMDSLQEEIAITAESMKVPEEDAKLTVSVDGGWQTRGSGRGYNSLTGHVTMVGVETGKVVGYDVRSKVCKKCENPKCIKHDCRKNWNGSSKAMEADIVVDLVKKNTQINALVGDEDTTTISRVHKEINREIKKRSDANHIKKIFSNSLYTLQKKNKKMSITIMKYVKKNFQYMCAQNQGDVEGIRQGLLALSGHPFGDHSNCNVSWCGYLKDKDSYTYKSLPYKRPLQDSQLRTELAQVLQTFLPHADKLASLSSTQSNESLNNTIASKAPKSRCYGKSSSLGFRVGAGVSQKNIGYQYVSKVHTSAGVSPGKFTSHRAALCDRQVKRLRRLGRSVKGKRRRLHLKARRLAANFTKEVREGDTYHSKINIAEDSPDITLIDAPVQKPVSTPIDLTNKPLVLFDLETTGFGDDAEITQIAATGPLGSFMTYVMPDSGFISKPVQNVTHLSIINSVMFHNSHPVQAVSPIKGMSSFLEYLESHDFGCVLVGHNVKLFDARVIMRSCTTLNLLERFSNVVNGFVDTLNLFKSLLPGLPSYRQSALYDNVIGGVYEAHNAMADVHSLNMLVTATNPSIPSLECHSFSVDFIVRSIAHISMKKTLLMTLNPLSGIVSNSMLDKIASSGLSYSDLCSAYKRGEDDGICSLFGEISNGKVRVTKSKKIIQKICEFLSNK